MKNKMLKYPLVLGVVALVAGLLLALVYNITAPIIEENKADMISLAMVDILTEAGMYTPEQRNQIIVTYAEDNMMMSKPTMSQAHRVRSVMQNYYFIKEGAIKISKDGILDVKIDKMVPTAKKMLEEIERNPNQKEEILKAIEITYSAF